MGSELDRIRFEGGRIAELARIMHEHGGTPMELLNRNPVLGGARVRISGDRACLDACEAYVRRTSWKYHRMRMGGQMTVNFPVTPQEVQRAIAADAAEPRSVDPGTPELMP